MIKQTLKITAIFSILILIAVNFFHVENNHKFLDLFARFIFDKNYYLSQYPDVKESGLDPFEHYSTLGWKEKKNPNADFDTAFCMNFNTKYKQYNLNPLQYYVRSILHFDTKYWATNSKNFKHVDRLLENPKYYLALVSVFRNEDRFLKEWIEFHILMGVEHFYLYNNLSEDNYKKVLEPYIRAGIVELYDIDTHPNNASELDKLLTSAYNKTINHVKNEVEWLIVCDTDEFFFPVKENNLVDLLKKYDDYPTLSVNWRIYGTSDVKRIAPNELMIEKLLLANNSTDERLVKSIVKPRFVETMISTHYPKLHPGYGQITENYEYFRSSFAPYQSRNIIRINHYWARDYDFFESRKLKRGHILGAKTVTGEEKEKKLKESIAYEKSNNIQYDDSILRFAHSLRQRIGLND